MIRRIPLLAFVSIAGFACTTAGKATPDEPRPITVPPMASASAAPAPAPAPSASAASAAEVIPSASAEDPKPMRLPKYGGPPREPQPAIGTACKAEDKGRCGTKGRIAMKTDHDGQFDTPCKLAPLGKPDPKMIRPEQWSACVDGDRLYAAGTCMVCRMDTRSHVVAVISEMNDTQVELMQKRFELPTNPPLRTAEAWRAAVASVTTK
jgi:hypothetical protein